MNNNKKQRSKIRILFVVNVDWFFFDHRLSVAEKCRENGFEVYVAAADTGSREKMEKFGFHFIPILALEKSSGILSELSLFTQLISLYKKIRPDIVHHVTIRPVLYGALAARLTGIEGVINELTGMGYLYINDSLPVRVLRMILNFFFRRGFRNKAARLILQNREDLDLVLKNRLTERKKAFVLGGTGVNLDKFEYSPDNPQTFHVIYTGRMLWDKGLGELIEAAEILSVKGVQCMIHLYGAPYPANPQSISEEQLAKWDKKENITCHGFQKDILPAIKKSNIVCLPSYREGLPKSLLEGAATGRALVAADVPGCREIVEDGVNGFLVPAKDPQALAEKIELLLRDTVMRQQMGKNARKKVEQEFSEEIVVAQTVELYEKLLEH